MNSNESAGTLTHSDRRSTGACNIDIVSSSPEEVTVRVYSELTEETAPSFGERIEQCVPATARLVLDLGGVTLLTTHGMAELLRIRRRHLARGRSVTIIEARGVTERALEISGLNVLFRPWDSGVTIVLPWPGRL